MCEYYRGAPPEFHDLYGYIASGMGKVGKNYLPERGYLTAFPTESPLTSSAVTHHIWPSNQLGIFLRDATEGIWVEGDALELAWTIVNSNVWSTPIEESGLFYHLALQIPGITMADPLSDPNIDE